MDSLARLALALVMNNRPITDETIKKLFKQVTEKLDKASSKEFFYIAMALARGLGRKF